MLVAAVAFWNFTFSAKNMVQIDQKYQFTGLIHQLNYIVHTHHESISPGQRANISKVVNFDFMVENYSPGIITPFHNNEYTIPVSDEDWNAFLNTYRELVIAYPGDFFQERSAVFATTMGLTGTAFIYPDEFEQKSKEGDFLKSTYGLERLNLAPGLTALHTKYLHSVYQFKSNTPIWNIFSPASPLLFFLLSLVVIGVSGNSEMIRFYLVTSTFCYVRLPAVFLLAPEPQLKYYAVLVYYCGFMVILGLLLFKSRKASSL